MYKPRRTPPSLTTIGGTGPNYTKQLSEIKNELIRLKTEVGDNRLLTHAEYKDICKRIDDVMAKMTRNGFIF